MAMTITTKYLPATNTRGSRIKASYGYGKGITIPFPYNQNATSAHWMAAEALLTRDGHKGIQFAAGEMIGGYAFVQVSDYNTRSI